MARSIANSQDSPQRSTIRLSEFVACSLLACKKSDMARNFFTLPGSVEPTVASICSLAVPKPAYICTPNFRSHNTCLFRPFVPFMYGQQTTLLYMQYDSIYSRSCTLSHRMRDDFVKLKSYVSWFGIYQRVL